MFIVTFCFACVIIVALFALSNENEVLLLFPKLPVQNETQEDISLV